MQQLKDHLKDSRVFSKEVLNWIAKENLWNIWVPKQFGGLELSFKDGLMKLQSLARLDGSLGWTVTLCSGANFFIGNLQPDVAQDIFKSPAILGGSGGMFGIATIEGDSYRLNGTWRYATGAPYLTHFTLNARIIENGEEQFNEDGTPKFLSFVIPADQVMVIEDWNTMGLKASATHSFEVNDVIADKRYSFVYNEFHQPQDIFKIHFSVFADLTLWVNYVGMAEHYLEEAMKVANEEQFEHLKEVISHANEKINERAEEVISLIEATGQFNEELISGVHHDAAISVKQLSAAIIGLHPLLGVKASREDHILNQIFRDYFTGTQHHIFTKSE
ncbi:MAG: acyl-CoA dehydrogenase [Flammeovirgaceae bacterium]|nr:acyl-CoA dehydrogenase [Flammeovirgaceae bacterium]HCX25169.1 acyl-CoA dehydrogenase [Cytophagales bacterium]|tara:strand:+ start:966 stop:1961 length:996 start_codon:yes stop_codon:yes gene_type:complete